MSSSTWGLRSLTHPVRTVLTSETVSIAESRIKPAMPRARLELARCCHRGILSPLRLPVPPSGLDVLRVPSYEYNCDRAHTGYTGSAGRGALAGSAFKLRDRFSGHRRRRVANDCASARGSLLLALCSLNEFFRCERLITAQYIALQSSAARLHGRPDAGSPVGGSRAGSVESNR